MTTDKPTVLVTRKLPQAIETRLKELFETQLNPTDAPMSTEALLAAAADCDVLVPTVTDRLAAEVIGALPDRLKLIANFGVGVDHIDLPAAASRGIVVTNTPGVLTEDTADLTMALMLSAPRRMVEGDRLARSGEWAGWTPTFMMGHRCRANGSASSAWAVSAPPWRAGRAASRCRSITTTRRRVHREIEAELEATWWEDLDQMLAHMDFVSINCPHTSETRHLLSEKRLRSLQPHAYVVNTARGEIIDEAALARCLAEGVLAGAGLDVYEREPRIEESLRRLDNVVLAPHLGSATREGRIAMASG